MTRRALLVELAGTLSVVVIVASVAGLVAIGAFSVYLWIRDPTLLAALVSILVGAVSFAYAQGLEP